jgi:AbrB family looped-hinge helix DNA binding protein
MQTVVTKRGQTFIPAAIRKRHRITGGSRLVWLDDGEMIRIVPTPASPIASLRGRGERLTEYLLKDHRADLRREERS